MAGIIKGKKDTSEADAKLVRKIKPRLRRFVIANQVQQAAKTANEQKKEADFLLQKDEVIKRSSRLACIAFLDKKIWKMNPPYFEMKWLKQGPATPELVREMNADIAGFATYLLREYNNFLKYKSLKRGYLNPMNEENLLFFWQKFNADLALLIQMDRKRMMRGNKPVIISPRSSIILPGSKTIN